MSVPVKIYRSVIYQEGQTPSNPNITGDPVINPLNPNGEPVGHNPVTIGSPANGLSITDDQVLTYDGSTIPTASVIGRYDIDTSGTTAPVGTKDIRYNNATQISATQLFISDITEDNIDVDFFLSLIKQGSALVIQDRGDHLNYQTYEVSGTPTFASATWTFPVTFKDSGGTGTTGFANNHKVLLSALSSGSGTIGGSIASGQVAFGTGTNTIGGDSGLTWNNTTKTLQVTTGSTAGILFAGTRLYEAQNQTLFTQLSVQPSSGNKAGVLQFLPSGTGNQSVLEFFEQSNPLDPTKRHIIRNNNSLLQIGGDGASKALEFISNNVSRMRMFSNGNFGFFTTTDAGFLVDINGTARIQNDLTLSDTRNLILGTGTGTKIGTATTQKIGFFNATPIVQPSGNIVTALQNLGLVASPSLFSGLTTNRIIKATSATTIGDGILADDSFGVYNTGKGNSTFFGYEAGLNDDGTDNLNVFVGNAAGKFNTSGIRNNFYGLQAGRDNTTGSYNNFFGSIAGRVNTTGSYNCFFGDASGVANTTGNYNCFFGLSAGEYHTSGDFNTFYGFSSGNNNATGSNNTFVGANSGSFIATGASLTTVNNSVFIGLDTRANANSQTNQIVIGYQAIGQGSNTITIGNTSITDNYIRGNFNITNGRNLIIGTTTGTKIGTATSQKLSFWNATPIVQPTTGIAESAFVENAGGTAVNDDSTFDGYTLRQVVKALRDAGLLA